MRQMDCRHILKRSMTPWKPKERNRPSTFETMGDVIRCPATCGGHLVPAPRPRIQGKLSPWTRTGGHDLSYSVCWIAESSHFPFWYRMKVQTSLVSAGVSSLPSTTYPGSPRFFASDTV